MKKERKAEGHERGQAVPIVDREAQSPLSGREELRKRFGLAEEVRKEPAHKSNDPDRRDADRHSVHPAPVHAARGEHSEPEDGQVEDDAVSLVEALLRAVGPDDRETCREGKRSKETPRHDRSSGDSRHRPKPNRHSHHDPPEGDDGDRVPIGERVASAVRPDGEDGDRNDEEGRDVGGAARSKDLFVQVELSPVASYPEIPGPHTPGKSGQVLRYRPIMLIVTLKRSLMLSAVLLVAALAGTAGMSSAAIKTGFMTCSPSPMRPSGRTRCRRHVPQAPIWPSRSSTGATSPE